MYALKGVRIANERIFISMSNLEFLSVILIIGTLGTTYFLWHKRQAVDSVFTDRIYYRDTVVKIQRSIKDSIEWIIQSDFYSSGSDEITSGHANLYEQELPEDLRDSIAQWRKLAKTANQAKIAHQVYMDRMEMDASDPKECQRLAQMNERRLRELKTHGRELLWIVDGYLHP